MWQTELLRLMESGGPSCGRILDCSRYVNATCAQNIKYNYIIYYESVLIQLWKITSI